VVQSPDTTKGSKDLFPKNAKNKGPDDLDTALFVYSLLGFIAAVIAWISFFSFLFVAAVVALSFGWAMSRSVLKRGKGMKFKGKWLARIGFWASIVLAATIVTILLGLIIDVVNTGFSFD
jgi:hypothetical protein